jgi:hypothetical protein
MRTFYGPDYPCTLTALLAWFRRSQTTPFVSDH